MPQPFYHLHSWHTCSLLRDTCMMQKCSVILPQTGQKALQNSEFIFAYGAFLVSTCRHGDAFSHGARWNWRAKGRRAGPPHFRAYSHSLDKFSGSESQAVADPSRGCSVANGMTGCAVLGDHRGLSSRLTLLSPGCFHSPGPWETETTSHLDFLTRITKIMSSEGTETRQIWGKTGDLQP